MEGKRGSGAGGFLGGIWRWRDGDGDGEHDDGDNGECEVLPLYNLPPSPSPYSESNSQPLSTQETPYGTTEWEEWDSDNDTDNDNGSAAKFGWEDQTTPSRSPRTEESGEESAAQTWQQAAGKMVVGEEGFRVVGLVERVKGWKGMMGLRW